MPSLYLVVVPVKKAHCALITTVLTLQNVIRFDTPMEFDVVAGRLGDYGWQASCITSFNHAKSMCNSALLLKMDNVVVG